MEHTTKVGVWRRLIATCFEVVLWLAKRNTNSAPSPCHEPFQAVPLSNPFQSACPPWYFALTLGCVQGLHKGPIDFGTKNDHQNHHRHGYPEQIRVDSPVHPLMKSHWQIMWVATWWTDYLCVNSLVTQTTTSNVPKNTIDSEVGVSKRNI